MAPAHVLTSGLSQIYIGEGSEKYLEGEIFEYWYIRQSVGA